MNKKSKEIVRFKPTSKPKPCERVEIGEIVLCKMRGYCEWPASVTELQKNVVHIEFFGDHTTHKSTLGNIYKFEESHDLILANLKMKKTPQYSKAVREAESVLGIPFEKSIMNQINT